MRSPLSLLTGLAALAMLASGPAFGQDDAQEVPLGDYSALELLGPCQESDSDARNGDVLELECEQYIMGFVHALTIDGVKTSCPPAVNTADEVRWAYMLWVNESYTERRQLSAAEALYETLKEKFPCAQ